MKRRAVSSLAAVMLVIGAIAPAIAHDGEHHGSKEETGWPGSARGQEVARALLADSQPAQELTAQSGETCDTGFAAGYPCKNVTLQALLPLQDIGGGKGNDVWGWTDPGTGNEYALMGRTNGTSFVDITVPTQPRYLGNLPTTRFASTWRDLKVYDDHVFVVSESRNHGMQIFDLRHLPTVSGGPVTFSEDAHYSGFNTAHNIAINETTGYAYAVGTDTCSGGLHIVDIRTPTAPRYVGCFSDDGYTHDVQCVVSTRDGFAGRELCFASNEDTLTVIDVTNKSATPVQLARVSYSGASYTHQGWLTEDQRYFLIDDELDEGKGVNTRTYVFDVGDPSRPVHIGTHVGSNTAIDHNQFIVGSHTYQANYRSGLRVLDVSGVSNVENGVPKPSLSEVAYFDIYPDDDLPEFNGAWSTYPFFASGNVLVSGIEQGLFVLYPHLGSDSTPTVSVNLEEPADGTTVSGLVEVRASASSGVEQLEFFVDETSIGVDADGADGWTAQWDTTTTSDGTHTVSATASAGGTQASDSVSVTVDNIADPAPTTVHVADLSGSSTGKGSNWTATVVIVVEDAAGEPVADATVHGSWSSGSPAAGSCVTGSSGSCSLTSGSLPKRQSSVVFSVTDVDHDVLTYEANDNVESSITIPKP